MPSEVNPKDVDSLLAKEMNQLSFQEREREYDRLHGIRSSEDADEDENQMQEALAQMQLEIDQLAYKPGYEEALRLNSQYVFDAKFRKRFLYADDLDPRKAAVRMTKFLEYSSEVFGPHVLMRKIMYSDLSPCTKACFRAGSCLILPVRDNSGRRVIVIAKDCMIKGRDREQLDHYLWQEFVGDEADQKKGIVLVVCVNNVVLNANDKEEKHNVARVVESLPAKFTAMHFLLPDNPLYHCIGATYALLVGKENRFRTRFHVGSPQEILYSLRTFGVPVAYLPQNLKPDCKQALKRHVKIVDTYESMDQARMNGHDFDQNPVVTCPTRKDVLLGKGREIMKHSGNLDMRHRIEERIHLWEQATNQEKSRVSKGVVHDIRASGGRFLKEDERGWFAEVDEETARLKVSIGFRDTVKRKKRRADELMNAAARSEYKDSPFATVQTLESDTFDFADLSATFFGKRRKMSDSETCNCFGFKQRSDGTQAA
ncbi:MAG: hypothetical protein SGILL_007403 [Bacillariaceae sp.]